jgi:energy-converting hydrogenase Eha subunit C
MLSTVEMSHVKVVEAFKYKDVASKMHILNSVSKVTEINNTTVK